MLRVSVLSLSRFSVQELAEFAENVEGLGYQALWLADERFFREVYGSLAYCATRTRTLELGVGVTDPYTRHPALTAMAVATLDEISGGRAILGLGAGVAGFKEMGLERPKPARALREAIQVIHPLLRGEPVTLEGEVITFRDGHLDFTPTRPDLPIYVASNNRLGLQVAGELADGVIMQGCLTDPMLNFFAAEVRTGANRAERPEGTPQLVARINVCLTRDRRAAMDAMRPGLAISLIAQQPTFWSWQLAGLEVPDEIRTLVDGLPYSHDPAVIRPVAEAIPDEWVDAFTLAGDVDYVADQVSRLARRGIDEFMLYAVPAGGTPLDVARKFAREVLPRVQAAV